MQGSEGGKWYVLRAPAAAEASKGREGSTANQLWPLLKPSPIASSWGKEEGWGASFIGSKPVSSGLFLPVLLTTVPPSLEHPEALWEDF